MPLAPRYRMALRASAICFLLGLLVTAIGAWVSVRWMPFRSAAIRMGLRPGDVAITYAWHRLRPDGYPEVPQNLVMAYEWWGYRLYALSADGAETALDEDASSAAVHDLLLVRAGWPLPALEGARWTTRHRAGGAVANWAVVHTEKMGVGPEFARIAPGLYEMRFMPTRPAWFGLTVDGVLWGGVLALPWLPFGVRRWRRESSGRCLGCGYPAGVREECSECGRVLAQEVRRRAGRGASGCAGGPEAPGRS